MEGSHIPFQPDRPSNVLDGNLVLAHLVSDHAEKMNRIGVIRLGRENLPIDLLGGLQPAGLMVLDRNRQCFGNRCHDVNYDNMTCAPQCVSKERAAPPASRRGRGVVHLTGAICRNGPEAGTDAQR